MLELDHCKRLLCYYELLNLGATAWYVAHALYVVVAEWYVVVVPGTWYTGKLTCTWYRGTTYYDAVRGTVKCETW